jgi:site-specific DNA-methyltransferase (adenine-specific)
MEWKVYCTTIEEFLEDYDGPKFHAVLCDPPYGLEFMGQEWDSPSKWDRRDHTMEENEGVATFLCSGKNLSEYRAGVPFQEWVTGWSRKMVRTLYPGTLCLFFGGTRTWHRLATGLEDGGLEMWDTLMWLYGSGFPKAQDIGKMIDAKAGAEREVVGVKPGHEEFANRRNLSSVQSLRGTSTRL